MEKPETQEEKRGSAESPDEMAPAALGGISSDEERGKSGAGKDDGQNTDFLGCSLRPKEPGLFNISKRRLRGALIALYKQLLVWKILCAERLFNLAEKGQTKPDFCKSVPEKWIQCLFHDSRTRLLLGSGALQPDTSYYGF